jgi:hypothetical protein
VRPEPYDGSNPASRRRRRPAWLAPELPHWRPRKMKGKRASWIWFRVACRSPATARNMRARKPFSWDAVDALTHRRRLCILEPHQPLAARRRRPTMHADHCGPRPTITDHAWIRQRRQDDLPVNSEDPAAAEGCFWASVNRSSPDKPLIGLYASPSYLCPGEELRCAA